MKRLLLVLLLVTPVCGLQAVDTLRFAHGSMVGVPGDTSLGLRLEYGGDNYCSILIMVPHRESVYAKLRMLCSQDIEQENRKDFVYIGSECGYLEVTDAPIVIKAPPGFAFNAKDQNIPFWVRSIRFVVEEGICRVRVVRSFRKFP